MSRRTGKVGLGRGIPEVGEFPADVGGAPGMAQSVFVYECQS